MKLKDARENYYFFSGKLSDVNRQLCFAGVAVVWIFFIKSSDGQYILSDNLLAPLACFVFSLTCDLLQYAFASVSWGFFHRTKEKEITEDYDFFAPRWINWTPIVFFILKVIFTLIGYKLLIANLLCGHLHIK